jgi:hypothetical protein
VALGWNVIHESKNRLKYKYLSVEIQQMWNMKYLVILIIIGGATGIVAEGLKNIWRQYQENIQ